MKCRCFFLVAMFSLVHSFIPSMYASQNSVDQQENNATTQTMEIVTVIKNKQSKFMFAAGVFATSVFAVYTSGLAYLAVHDFLHRGGDDVLAMTLGSAFFGAMAAVCCYSTYCHYPSENIPCYNLTVDYIEDLATGQKVFWSEIGSYEALYHNQQIYQINFYSGDKDVNSAPLMIINQLSFRGYIPLDAFREVLKSNDFSSRFSMTLVTKES